MENNIDNFLKSCDELINCKFLVAEYKLQKMLQELANTQEICTLIGECLEAFNRDREFSKSFVQDGNGEFMFLLPDEEYKILALVFCTLMDIDAKKIDFTDFVKRFFGNSENPYQEFVKEMILPFKKLIEEAFGYSSPKEENSDNNIEEITEEANKVEDENKNEKDEGTYIDKFAQAQKIAVQILSQLEYARADVANNHAMHICRAIVKTSSMNDEDVTSSLAVALKSTKAKQVKFLIKELYELFF